MNSERLPDISLSLNFYGDSFNPDEVTQRLGIEPTECHRIGDPIPRLTENARPGKYRHDGWRLMQGPCEAIEIDRLLNKFQKLVDVPGETIRQVCSDLEVEAVVICGVLQPISSATPNLCFPTNFLRWVADMEAEIYFDLIVSGRDI